MLIELHDGDGTPVYINPRYVIAVREETHRGRPGVASEGEYRDTLVMTTKHEFNVRETPDVVARELARASRESGAGGEGGPEAG